MYWYVLFTRTGREEIAEKILKKHLDNALFLPFIPMSETIFRCSGHIKKELKPLFPSYVFIESNLPSIEMINKTKKLIFYSKDIIRYLKYEDTGDIAMREHEKNMLLKLCNNSHLIEPSSGVIVGSKVYIKEGPLMGLESIVRKIDRHKRRAVIEVDFMGTNKSINVALEIVEKI